MSNSLTSALAQWRSALSPGQVITRDSELEPFNKSTFVSVNSISAVLLPTSTEEVSQCLAIANEFSVSTYAVSKGQNYGLGSKLPVERQAVLIDLSEMNRIEDFSEELAYITVQPGVSFRQVSEFLLKRGSKLIIDSIGSTGESSIIGNTAERGHGVALLSDRFNHTCGMEVVLPSGEIVNTGFSSFGKSKLSALSKWGLGPSLDGLFTQSNLGVITRLTVWLQPKPESFRVVMFQIEDEENLGKVSEIIRDLKLRKFPLSLRIFNDVRMIGFLQQYPWEHMKHATPLSTEVLKEIKANANITGKWVGLGGLYPVNEEFARVEKEYLSRALSPFVTQVEFYDEQRATAIKQHGNDAERHFIELVYSKSILRGFTTESTLNMCYWRVKKPIPNDKDLHRDQCGVLWYCPAVPSTGDDIRKAVEIIEEACREYRMEPNIGFLFITDRVVDITGAICYDKSDLEQERLANACHDQIMSNMVETGFSPYRLGIQSMHLVSGYTSSNKELLQALKGTIDPLNILSIGRYIPNDR